MHDIIIIKCASVCVCGVYVHVIVLLVIGYKYFNLICDMNIAFYSNFTQPNKPPFFSHVLPYNCLARGILKA